jgi:pathogenesis-related protein 1
MVAVGLFGCQRDVPGTLDAGNTADGHTTDGRANAFDGQPMDGRVPAVDAAAGVGEPAELVGITLYHNQARLAENANPALPQMQWDPALAAIAAAWGAMCQDNNGDGLIDHNPNRSATYPTYVGENVYGAGGGASAQQAVNLWMAEKSHYDHASNRCSGVCGHYTQIVWRETDHVGCALAVCPSLRFGNAIICDYGPGGNFGGQPPY